MPRRRTPIPTPVDVENDDLGTIEPSLFPETRVYPDLMEIDLDDIIATGIVPDNAFIDSVRQWGILQPVVLVQFRDRYRIAAGRRRVRAAIAAGLNEIPALVFPSGTTLTQANAMALVENNQRHQNVVSDLEAIEALVHEGVPMESIASQLGIPIGTLRARMRLAGLIPGLRQTLQDGRMSPSVALTVSSLPVNRQSVLFDRLERESINNPNARITATMAREARQAYQQQAVDIQLTDELFAVETDVQAVATDEAPEPPPVADTIYSGRLHTDRRGQFPMLRQNDQSRVPTGVNIVLAPNNQSARDVMATIYYEDGSVAVAPVNAMLATVDITMTDGTPPWNRPIFDLVRDRVSVVNSQSLLFRGETWWSNEYFNNVIRLHGEEVRRIQRTGGGNTTVVDQFTIAVGPQQTHYISVERANALVLEARQAATRTVAPPAAVIPEGMSRDDVVRTLVDSGGWSDVGVLLDALEQAMPAEPDDSTDRIHEAFMLFRSLLTQGV